MGPFVGQGMLPVACLGEALAMDYAVRPVVQNVAEVHVGVAYSYLVVALVDRVVVHPYQDEAEGHPAD